MHNYNMKATWDNITYTTDDASFQWYINNGKAEPYPRELNIVKSYLNKYPHKNNLFIDVGGHIGTTSLPYSRLFKNVIAFEPNTVSYNFFLENMKNNNINNVKVFNKGVFNKSTTCNIVKHGENSGCYYIAECDKHEKSIDVVRLDDLEYDLPVDFIKIDTEGSEVFALEGAYNVIAKYKPLINLETNACSMKYFGYKKERIFEFLKALDYDVLDDDGNNPLFSHKEK